MSNQYYIYYFRAEIQGIRKGIVKWQLARSSAAADRPHDAPCHSNSLKVIRIYTVEQDV